MKKKNYFLFIPLIILMIYSLLNLYNARLLDSLYNNIYLKQLLWYFIGFSLIFILKKFNLNKIFKASFYIYFISLFLLIIVLFIGKEVNGSRAWLNFGFISFQPSELMRLSLALYLTNYTDKYHFKGHISELKYLLISFMITLIPSVIVFLEPDTGAIIFYLIIYLTIIIYANINHKWYYLIFSLLFILIILFIYLYLVKQDILIKLMGTSLFYRIDRIVNFYNQTGYQSENALTTLGSASFFGMGINKILLYIPEGSTDFILAFSAGNYGIIAIIIILLSYLIIDIYLLKKISLIQNKRNKIFFASFISVFFFQQFYNILMNLNLLPIMGIPLPFLSYGGSTLIVYFLYLSLILKMD